MEELRPVIPFGLDGFMYLCVDLIIPTISYI